MYAIDELKGAGFDVWAESGKIRYKQVTEGPVDAAWINSLLQNIKEHKGEAIGYLQKPTSPKQNSCPVTVPDAELISRDLKYLAGVTVNLTGWTLWKRIEQGKEHRWATDPAGVIRWERYYSERLTLAAGTDQGHNDGDLNLNEQHKK